MSDIKALIDFVLMERTDAAQWGDDAPELVRLARQAKVEWEEGFADEDDAFADEDDAFDDDSDSDEGDEEEDVEGNR